MSSVCTVAISWRTCRTWRSSDRSNRWARICGGPRSLQGEVFCKSDMASLLRHTVGSVKTHNEKERSHVLPGRFRPMADDDYATSVPSEQAASHRLGSLELRHGAGPLVRPDGGESRAGQGGAAQRTDGAPAAAG